MIYVYTLDLDCLIRYTTRDTDSSYIIKNRCIRDRFRYFVMVF